MNETYAEQYSAMMDNAPYREFKDEYGTSFEDEQYVVDLSPKFGGYEQGDIVCESSPFSGVPLRLKLAIRRDGSMVFHSWSWDGNDDSTCTMRAPDPATIEPTQEQIDTVNGLFSGRIRWEGLKLTPGGTPQRICPIDLQPEEAQIGRKMYLA